MLHDDGLRTMLHLEDLHPYRGNPRNGDVALIKASLLEHGQYRPAVVNDTEDGYVVLAGNHLVQAMRELNDERPNEGWDVVWVHVVELGEQQARRLSLTDNRTSDRANYDPYELLAELELLDTLDGTGYSDSDLEALERTISNDPAPGPEEIAADDPFPYPGMRTVTLNLMEPLWEQWTDYTSGFDSPEEALEHLLDHGVGE